jgi:hypothetical protein
VAKGSQDLVTILDSLNKLADLEKRITNLEAGNEYEQLLERERPPPSQRTSLEFKKKRTTVGDGGGGVKLVYSLREKKTAWDTKGASRTNGRAAGGGAAAVRARQQQSGMGTFLTGVDGAEESDTEDPRYNYMK